MWQLAVVLFIIMVFVIGLVAGLNALGTSRKFLLPLLGILDATGVTRRREDLRIGGPRLHG